MLTCRHCFHPLEQVFVDLGTAPPSNAYLSHSDLYRPELYLPLKVFVCEHCFLVQIDEVMRHDQIFHADYAYFSSYSTTWLEHCREFTDMICQRQMLTKNSQVIEVASNDGYLLQYFMNKDIPCLGIEPTAATAAAARQRGQMVIEAFFGESLAHELREHGYVADLLIANNVLAHVPDINGFLRGIHILLAQNGVATLEFPHLMKLVENRQFDTIYHEHYSYFSLLTVTKICEAHRLYAFDVEQISTHGGSLRLYVCRDDNPCSRSSAYEQLLREERHRGMDQLDYYKDFQPQIEDLKFNLWRFLLDAQKTGQRVAAYGAAAKGNTLINFARIQSDLIPFVADISPHKQGKFLPGSRIPIVSPDELLRWHPDIVWILPWNLKEEIISQLWEIKAWGGQFFVAIPDVRVFS